MLYVCVCVCVCVCMLVAQSCPTFATQGTAAHQGPLSMEFSKQEHWSRLLFPSSRCNATAYLMDCSIM